MKAIKWMVLMVLLLVPLGIHPAAGHAAESVDSLAARIIKYPAGAYDASAAAGMAANIKKFGANILQGMLNKGVEIHLTSGPITTDPSMAYLKGVVPRGWEGTGLTWDDVPGSGGKPVVLRIGYSNKGMGHSSNNLELHETAHAVDTYVMGGSSKTAAFKQAFQSEAVKLFGNDGYMSVYPEEFFAESSCMYFLNSTTKSQLKTKAPVTYAYLQQAYSTYRP